MMAAETVVTVDNNRAPNNTTQEAPLGWLKLNIDYFKTVPGILKLIELLFGIICMAAASPALISGTHWFLFVAVVAFIGTLIWSFAYLLGIREALKLPINWLLTELFNTAVITILYAIAFIVQLSAWSPLISNYKSSNIAAGCFGLFNTLVYAAGTYFLYVENKAATSS